MRLEGQTVVVTGASRGLGRAIALAMAEEGAQLVLAARDEQALNAVASLIEQLGREALVVRCDVRDPADINVLIERSIAAYGKIDTLVNSAGVALRRSIDELSTAEWDDIHLTLVRGTLLAIQATLPGMIARKHGNIINLIAPLERIVLPGFAAYASAMYAVVGLCKTLAMELRPHGINVNGLHPGEFTNTALMRGMLGGNPPSTLLDPAMVTPAAIVLAAQPSRGLTGDIVDALAWNTDTGLGGGLG